MDRELTREEYNNATRCYWKIINTFPIRLQKVMPFFDSFISSATLHLHSDYVYLGPTGQQRFDMLHSPHAAALLRAYAIQRLEKTDGNDHN